MPNRDWGREDDEDRWVRDERWRRDMGRDFSRQEWSPYDRAREVRGDYRESGFGFGGTDRDFGGGGFGGYGNYGERGWGERGPGERWGMGERGYGRRGWGERDYADRERGWGDRYYGERGYPDRGTRIWGGPSMAERSLGDRGAYEGDRSQPYGIDRYGGTYAAERYERRPIGRAPRGYQRSDERIKEDLCDRLMHSWIDAEDVDIQVRGGEVTLGGTVEDRASKRAVEDLADNILGVTDVQNHIRVRPRGQDGDRAPVSATMKKPTA